MDKNEQLRKLEEKVRKADLSIGLLKRVLKECLKFAERRSTKKEAESLKYLEKQLN